MPRVRRVWALSAAARSAMKRRGTISVGGSCWRAAGEPGKPVAGVYQTVEVGEGEGGGAGAKWSVLTEGMVKDIELYNKL